MKWDSDKPQKVYSDDKCIGRLMPKAKPENLGYGFQPWSKPKQENRNGQKSPT